MTEDQFRWLSNNCDQILLAEEATESTIAISWLHVIRPHPGIYIKYKELFITNASLRQKFSLFLEKFLDKARQVIQILLIIKESINISYEKCLGNNIDILIVSHLLNDSTKNNDDLYYGDLPLILENAGYRVFIAYIDHTSGIKIKVRKGLLTNGAKYLVLPKALTRKSEIQITKNLKAEKLRILNLAEKNKLNPEKFNFLKNLSRQVLSTESKGSYRIGLQVGELVKKFQPK